MWNDRSSQSFVSSLLSVLRAEFVVRGDGVGSSVAEMNSSGSESDSCELEGQGKYEEGVRQKGLKEGKRVERTVAARSICFRASASSSSLRTRGSISTVVLRAQREKTSETETRRVCQNQGKNEEKRIKLTGVSSLSARIKKTRRSVFVRPSFLYTRRRAHLISRSIDRVLRSRRSLVVRDRSVGLQSMEELRRKKGDDASCES